MGRGKALVVPQFVSLQNRVSQSLPACPYTVRRERTSPDSSEEEGPEEIMDQVRSHVMPIVRATYPDARSRLIKRAILIRFNDPNDDGVDPSVDLVVALTRKDGDGIWIPNRDYDDWDASHPECHTRLLTAEPKAPAGTAPASSASPRLRSRETRPRR